MAFPEELRAAFPSYGAGWDAAVALGVDVSMLVENLQLTPTQRLEQLESLINETDALLRDLKPVRRDSVP